MSNRPDAVIRDTSKIRKTVKSIRQMYNKIITVIMAMMVIMIMSK
jgi:hypothetical protein